jgi:hypothetical protein
VALKIIGRTPRLSVAESRIGAGEAKHATMRCSACLKNCFVSFPFEPTKLQRQQIMKAALDEHRRVCTVGQAEDYRSFHIEYGRK